MGHAPRGWLGINKHLNHHLLNGQLLFYPWFFTLSLPLAKIRWACFLFYYKRSYDNSQFIMLLILRYMRSFLLKFAKNKIDATHLFQLKIKWWIIWWDFLFQNRNPPELTYFEWNGMHFRAICIALTSLNGRFFCSVSGFFLRVKESWRHKIIHSQCRGR